MYRSCQPKDKYKDGRIHEGGKSRVHKSSEWRLCWQFSTAVPRQDWSVLILDIHGQCSC